MKGDFTRDIFKPANHYSSVRSQQGRVQVDADWNEAVDILAHWDRTTRRDVIGLCGGPQGRDGNGNDLAGFFIKVVNDELRITKGRYYVDGLLVENEAEVAITAQPDLPGDTLSDVLVPAGTLKPGKYLAYLDVWERHVTALEDPHIREVALGGPDTTTRTKVVWQVRLMQVPGESEEEGLHCASEIPLWAEVTEPSSGRLSAQAEESGEVETEPCEVPAQAGYRGLENQLYRVEVHRVIPPGQITLKWSRENGSVVFGWADQDKLNPNKLTLSSPGRDEVLGLAADDWVELIDDNHELRGEPGLLVKVVNVEGKVLTIDPGSETVKISEFPVNPKVRRWDMPRDKGEIIVNVPEDGESEPIPLENGIKVKLESGTYRTGDYWLIPARTASRNIDWPREGKKPLSQPRHGIHHHYCRLALLSFKGTESEVPWEWLGDCRQLFPPLTEMVRFFHVAGDGQEAMPGHPVPRPLQVGLVNGQQPVAGARVQFLVVGGNGRVLAPGESLCSGFKTGGGKVVETETGPDGVASCCWRLDKGTVSQQVEVKLLQIDGKPMVDGDGNPLLPPVRFNANLSQATRVAYDPGDCPDLSSAQTVQQAIDLLCQRPQGGGCCVTVGRGGEYDRLDKAITDLIEKGHRDICLCLLARDPQEHPEGHLLPGLELNFPEKKSEVHLKIAGCGLGSRVSVQKPVRLSGLKSFTLHDVALEVRFLAEGGEGAIALDRCSEVRLTACHLSGFTAGDEGEAKGALLSITNTDRIQLRDNVMEAALRDSLKPTRKIFKRAEVDFLENLFGLPEQGVFQFEKFRLNAVNAASELAKLNISTRKQIHAALQEAIKDNLLSTSENFTWSNFRAALTTEAPQPEDLFDSLIDLRRAAIKARPGVALVLSPALREKAPETLALVGLDDDDYTTLESNQLVGILSLHGLPAPANLIAEVFSEGSLQRLEGLLKEQEIKFVGRQGTLQLRGNQLVQLALARQTISQIQQLVSNRVPMFNLFSRCLMSDNVIEGAVSALVTEHVAMTANEFSTMALVVEKGEEAPAPPILANVVADTSIYVGNHCRRPNGILRNASRDFSQVANLQITLT